MKILLSNNNFINYNFKQSSTPTVDIGQLTGVNNSVDTFVKTKFEKNKQNRINILSSIIYDKFAQNYNQKINDIEKFKQPYNKALVLQKLAQSYRKEGEVEKAGILLAQSFNLLKTNEPYRQESIKKIIESKENKSILEDFFYCSNNIKAKYFVMKSLNKLDNPYYLSIAESICDCDTEKVTPNDKKTIYEARLLLNRYYNLDQLSSYLNENINYKIAVLNLLSKWGIEKHQEIPQKLFNDENEYVEIKAQQTKNILKNISKFYDLDEETIEPNRQLPKNNNALDKISLLKIIEANKNNKIDIDIVKQLGQLGFTIKDAQSIMPKNKNNYSKNNTEQIEAFLKIMIRGHLDKSCLM